MLPKVCHFGGKNLQPLRSFLLAPLAPLFLPFLLSLSTLSPHPPIYHTPLNPPDNTAHCTAARPPAAAAADDERESELPPQQSERERPPLSLPQPAFKHIHSHTGIDARRALHGGSPCEDIRSPCPAACMDHLTLTPHVQLPPPSTIGRAEQKRDRGESEVA